MEEENKPTSNNMLDVRQPFDSNLLITNIKSQILQGNINALEGWVIVKRMAKIGETVLEDSELKELAIKEFNKYTPEKGKKSVTVFSANISHCAVHTAYDFKECGHEVLNELYNIQAQVKEVIAQIEEELKLIIPSETKQAQVFGVESHNVDKLFPKFPKLVWENNSGIVYSCEPPRKIQKMGLKFNKV